MKKLLVVLFALGTVSVFAGERSLSECAITVNNVDKRIYLTNDINKEDRTLKANCLDAVKHVLDMIVIENGHERRAKGVVLDYVEPSEF
jgi:hypothetical protein